MKRLYSIILFCCIAWNTFACTSVIVSGKVTTDGRPCIFKNRDASNTDIVVMSVQGKRYHYIATVTANDLKTRLVRSGFNEKGFSIINTYTKNQNGTRQDSGNNNRIMRRALESCASTKDFERMLDSLPHPLKVNSNYGVMDAEGNVAYYEVGNFKYVKYDVNDPKVAPNGYLVRTNFAVSGNREKDVGVTRYKAMNTYMLSLRKRGKISHEDIIRGATRYFVHGESGVDLNEMMPEIIHKPVYVSLKDYITNRLTTSAQLIQGVKKGEDPLHTVGWTICGSPMTTVCIPVWITPDYRVPRIMSRNSSNHASICDAGLKLKKRLFPDDKKRGKNDINIAQLINKKGNGILQQITPIETEIFRRAKKVQNTIQIQGFSTYEINEFYTWVDSYVASEYKKRFGIILE